MPYYNPLFADRFSWALELRIRCGSVSYVEMCIRDRLDADRLVFDNSQPGDYELISLADFTFGEQAFEANASLDAEGRLVRGDADAADNAARSTVPGPADPKPDSFELCLLYTSRCV